MSAISQVSRKLVGQNPGPVFHVAFVVYATLGCIVGGLITYYLIEVRIQRAVKQRRASRVSSAVPSGS